MTEATSVLPSNAAPAAVSLDAPAPIPFPDRTQKYIDEESVLNRKLMVFGTDVGEIPCFRRSFLWGIGGGMGLGIAHFAVTSRIPAATKFGFWSYVGITLGVWCYCRYDFTVTKREYAQLQYAMQKNAEKEGTKDALPRMTNADVVE